MSTLNVDKVDPNTGTALEIGSSGDTVTVPSGATLTLTSATLNLPTTITSTTEVKTNKISPATGVAFAMGDSGDTFTVPSGATIVNSGTATGFGITAANFRPNAKPLIINGDMAIVQRSTSVTAVTTEGYKTCDRFKLNGTVSGAELTIIQEALSSGNAYDDGFRTAWRADCTTATAPASLERLELQYKFESQDCQLFKSGTSNAQKFTLSFWVKSSYTGATTVNLFNFDSSSRFIGATYTISVADTWEKKVLNYAADTSVAFDNNNGVGLGITFGLASGSDYTGGSTPSAWQAYSGEDMYAGGTPALSSNIANDWAVTGVQLEVGEYTSSTLPPFQHESYGDNLARCQRYYYFHASEATNEGIDTFLCVTMQYNTTSMTGVIPFPITMRTNPSIDQLTGTNMYRVYENDSNATMDSLSLSAQGTNNCAGVQNGTSITVTSGSAGLLQTMHSTATLAFDAEL
jgi:hypothetical protein